MSRVSARTTVPARVAWAVDLLDVQPDDQILEIGCGPGVAVALICERLDRGQITAIDRSPTAIDRTRARSRHHEAARRVVLEQVDLAGLQSEPDQFGKAFAVNVNVFWTGSADAECSVLARVLRPAGLLRLVYAGPPGQSGKDDRDVASRVAGNLERHGFATEVIHGPTGGMVCITGRLDSTS